MSRKQQMLAVLDGQPTDRIPWVPRLDLWYQDLRSPDDDVHRALGIFNLHSMPFRTVFEGIDWTVTHSGDRTIVEYRTPAGTLTTRTVYDERMRAAGITISHVERYAFHGPEDYRALEFLFRHARAEPNYEGYARQSERIGDRGHERRDAAPDLGDGESGVSVRPLG